MYPEVVTYPEARTYLEIMGKMQISSVHETNSSDGGVTGLLTLS